MIQVTRQFVRLWWVNDSQIDGRRPTDKQANRERESKTKQKHQFSVLYYYYLLNVSSVLQHCCAKQKTHDNFSSPKEKAYLASVFGSWRVLTGGLCWLCYVGLCWTAGVNLRLSLWCPSNTWGLFINALPYTDLPRITLHLDMVQTVLEFMYASVFCEGPTSSKEFHTTCFAALWGHQ